MSLPPYMPGGEGAEAAIDCVGGDALEAVVAALRPGGTVWVYGSLSGAHAKLKVRQCARGRGFPDAVDVCAAKPS